MRVEVVVLGSASPISLMVSVDVITVQELCVRVEVVVLGSASPISLMVSVDVIIVQELCESRGGRPGLHVPNKPYGISGRNHSSGAV